jgi:hypothetical protein
MEILMSTFSKTLALGLFLLVNACGASTITASSRIEGGAGAGAGLGPIVEARTPPNAEAPMFDRQVADRSSTIPRDTPTFRIESDCWRCR